MTSDAWQSPEADVDLLRAELDACRAEIARLRLAERVMETEEVVRMAGRGLAPPGAIAQRDAAYEAWKAARA